MSDDGSVSAWLDGLKDGESRAAAVLWQRYQQQILQHARRRLDRGARRVADEEDVALSAFHSLCRGAERGAFAKLDDRNDLWQLLMMLTARKARRQLETERRLKRGGGKVRTESALDARDAEQRGIEQVAGALELPEMLVILEDELERLMDLTRDDSLREIATLRMEGYTNQEIAERTGRSLRAVERKLKLIRDIWTKTDS